MERPRKKIRLTKLQRKMETNTNLKKRRRRKKKKKKKKETKRRRKYKSEEIDRIEG